DHVAGGGGGGQDFRLVLPQRQDLAVDRARRARAGAVDHGSGPDREQDAPPAPEHSELDQQWLLLVRNHAEALERVGGVEAAGVVGDRKGDVIGLIRRESRGGRLGAALGERRRGADRHRRRRAAGGRGGTSARRGRGGDSAARRRVAARRGGRCRRGRRGARRGRAAGAGAATLLCERI